MPNNKKYVNRKNNNIRYIRSKNLFNVFKNLFNVFKNVFYLKYIY